jgi:hypothetical protein
VGGWRRYLKLQAQAKTGLSYGPLVWGGFTLVFWALAFVWIIVSAFIWLAERYAPLVAALALTGFFLLTAVVALGYCLRDCGKSKKFAASHGSPLRLRRPQDNRVNIRFGRGRLNTSMPKADISRSPFPFASGALNFRDWSGLPSTSLLLLYRKIAH